MRATELIALLRTRYGVEVLAHPTSPTGLLLLRREGPPPQEARPLIDELRERKSEARRVVEAGWPAASIEAECAFGVPHARIYPLLGSEVRHRDGWGGRLCQVFQDRALVHRPGARRLEIVHPSDLLPPGPCDRNSASRFLRFED